MRLERVQSVAVIMHVDFSILCCVSPTQVFNKGPYKGGAINIGLSSLPQNQQSWKTFFQLYWMWSKRKCNWFCTSGRGEINISGSTKKREMEIRRQSNKREEGMGVTTGHEETTTTVDWGGRPVTLRSMVGWKQLPLFLVCTSFCVTP